jgi:hypothetical protein
LARDTGMRIFNMTGILSDEERERNDKNGASTGNCAQNYHEYIIQELRCASLRARLAQADIESVGIALRDGLINEDQAIDILSDCDCLQYIEPTPPSRKGAT